MKNESRFQRELIERLESMFPGCEVMKQDPTYKQGFPDLVIFFKDKYAILEVKKSEQAAHQPNQDYYISKFKNWVVSSFVSPENLEEVLHELQQAFRA